MITPVPNEIIWCYGFWQTAYHEISDTVIFCEGLPDIQNEDNKCRLVIADDLMCEADKSLTYLFTKGRHQKNISAIYIVRIFFGGGGGGRENKQQGTWSLNSYFSHI